MAYKDFTSLPVWQRAFRLLTEVYKYTKDFPMDERFGLISDMRRAANSVIHNIAEGFGRFERKDKTRFYKIARGSCYEIISQTLASNALDYLTDMNEEYLLAEYKEVIGELDALIKTIETRQSP